MKAFLFGAAMMALAAPAAAQDWRPLGFMGEGSDNYRIVYLDGASIRTTSANGREMKISHSFARQQKFPDGMAYDWIEVTYTLDCGTEKMRSIRSVSMRAGTPLVTSTNPGDEIPFTSNLPFLRAAKIACAGGIDEKLLQRTMDMPGQAAERFEAAAALDRSSKALSWSRTGKGGEAGTRIALFLDRASIVQGPAGTRYATMLAVSERPGAPLFNMTRVAIDCAAGTRRQLLAWFPPDNGDGERTLIFPRDAAAPLQPGSIWASLRAPVCSGDYSASLPYDRKPEEIRPTAFD